MPDPCVYTVDGSVASVTLNRPEARNSLNVAAKVELLAAAARGRGRRAGPRGHPDRSRGAPSAPGKTCASTPKGSRPAPTRSTPSAPTTTR